MTVQPESKGQGQGRGTDRDHDSREDKGLGERVYHLVGFDPRGHDRDRTVFEVAGGDQEEEGRSFHDIQADYLFYNIALHDQQVKTEREEQHRNNVV